VITVPGGVDLVGTIVALPALISVLRPVIPQQRHHHLACGYKKVQFTYCYIEFKKKIFYNILYISKIRFKMHKEGNYIEIFC